MAGLWRRNSTTSSAERWPMTTRTRRLWRKPSDVVWRRWTAWNWSGIRPCRSANPLHSGCDHPRHQRDFRTAASGAGPPGLGLGCIAAAGRTLHHVHHARGDPVWFGAAAKRQAEAALESAVAAIFAEDLAGPILPFHGQAAHHYARIAAAPKRRQADGWLRRPDRRGGSSDWRSYRNPRHRRIRGLRCAADQPAEGADQTGARLVESPVTSARMLPGVAETSGLWPARRGWTI